MNWNRPDMEIVKEVGVTRQMVSLARRRYAEDTVAKYDARKTTKWDGINWDQPTCAISKQLGVDPGYISALRKRKAPDTCERWAFQRKPVNYRDVDWSKPVEELAALLGITRWIHQRIHGLRRRFAPQLIRPLKHADDFASVDWSKRNSEIAKEMNLTSNGVHLWRIRLAPETIKRRNNPLDPSHRLA